MNTATCYRVPRTKRVIPIFAGWYLIKLGDPMPINFAPEVSFKPLIFRKPQWPQAHD